MNTARRRATVALMAMLGTSGVTYAVRPTQHMADGRPRVSLEQLFPKSFADWVVDDRMPVQLVSPDAQAVLNAIYNETLSRTYVNRQGQRIMLSVAYGGDQSDGTRAHRPEVCYPAQGFQVMASEEGVVQMPSHPLRVKRLVARQGGRNEPITYWIVVGDRIALSGTEQKVAQLSYGLRGVIPDGMLVRVSSIDSNPKQAYDAQAAFLVAMASALRPDLQARVVGAGGA